MLTWRFYPSDDLEKIPCRWSYHTKRRQKNRRELKFGPWYISTGSALPKCEIKSFILKLVCVCVHVCAHMCVCMCVCVHHVLCSVTQSCMTLFDPMNCSPQGSSIHDISQARIMDWVAISFSRESSELPGIELVSLVSCISCIGRWILHIWNGYPLQYSCLGNPVDRGAWQPTVHGITKSWTWLSD